MNMHFLPSHSCTCTWQPLGTLRSTSGTTDPALNELYRIKFNVLISCVNQSQVTVISLKSGKQRYMFLVII
jgi:hypothetical protein